MIILYNVERLDGRGGKEGVSLWFVALVSLFLKLYVIISNHG